MDTTAQFEGRLISQPTRDAFAAKKAQGVRLGGPTTLPEKVVKRVLREREQGRKLVSIADNLTEDGIATAQGGAKWYPSTVAAVLKSVERERERRS